MSIFSISSMYNRFSKWAEKQPQAKLDKLYREIATNNSYFSYLRYQESYAYRVKSLAKDGAVFTARELLAAVKQEARALSMFSRDEPKVVRAMLAAGAFPDDACFSAANAGLLPCFRAQLEQLETVSSSAVHYAIRRHGDDVALIDQLLARKPALTAGMVTSVLTSRTIADDKRLDVVNKLLNAGVQPDKDALEYAAQWRNPAIALRLLEAGAPVSVDAMLYAIDNGMQSVVEKLHEKGCSFDEALAKSPKELQVRVKAYRKLIAGVSESEELIVELQAQIKELTARLEKIEGAGEAQPKKPAAGKAAKPQQ